MNTIASFDETVTLADKYLRTEGRVFLSGTQALVRLALLPVGFCPTTACLLACVGCHMWALL